MKCIILAGGSGDRLWPVSRRNYPKQFINIEGGHSLFQEAVMRNLSFCDEFLVVTNERYRYIVEGQMQEFPGVVYRCFLEVAARGTMAASAVPCMCMNPSQKILVVSADHIIRGDYKQTILKAMEAVSEGKIVCIGEQCESGVLLAEAGIYLRELKRHGPRIYRACKELVRNTDLSSRVIVLDRGLSVQIPRESIGEALVKRAGSITIIREGFRWHRFLDLPSLAAYQRGKNNGHSVVHNCSKVDILNYAEDRTIIANGISDAIIVNTADSVYVTGRGNTEDIKKIMEQYNGREQKAFDEGTVCYRPWGIKETLTGTFGYSVKKLTIFSGKALSGHLHERRSEHWSVVSGTATIEMGGAIQEYGRNERVFVPSGIVHKIENRFGQDLVIIETSIGDDLSSRDVHRTDHTETPDIEVEDIKLVRLRPAFKDYLWGGERLKKEYHKTCDYERVAESWELSAHPSGQSVIAEGKYQGMLFGDFIKRMDPSLLGWKSGMSERFPLLVKFIDAKESLSIQVHPDDQYALREEKEFGKNEMWYILDCEEDAYIYCGFAGQVTEEEVRRKTRDHTLTDLLQKIPVKKGETYFIWAGLVHGIGPGILACEIQQNSDITYRLYDYGRKDQYGEARELHLEKALQVMEFGGYHQDKSGPKEGEQEHFGSARIVGQCKYFTVVHYEINGERSIRMDESSFASVVILEGKGKISADHVEMEFHKGESFFVTAGQKFIKISGNCQLLLTRV